MSPNHPCSLLVTAASDPTVSCERLIRAAFVVAKGFTDTTFAAWCEAELNGYYNRQQGDLPEYRWAHGTVMVKDTWGQTYPGMFKSAKDQERLGRAHIAEPIGQIEKNSEMPPDTEFYVSYSPEMATKLRQAFGGATDVFRLIQRLAFENVLTQARQKVFMWAVENSALIAPPDLPSTTARLLGITHAQAPRTVPSPIAVEGLNGSITMSHSNLIVNSGGTTASVVHHQGIDRDALVLLAKELREALASIDTAHRPADLVASADELAGLAEMSAPRPSFVREALSSLRTVLEGGTGAVLGELSKPYLLTLIANVLKG